MSASAIRWAAITSILEMNEVQHWLRESNSTLSCYNKVNGIRGCDSELSRCATSAKVLQRAAVEILSCLREAVSRWREQPWNEWLYRTRMHRIMPQLFINRRASAVFNSLLHDARSSCEILRRYAALFLFRRPWCHVLAERPNNCVNSLMSEDGSSMDTGYRSSPF